jgi:hypothetical protein
MDSWTAAVTIFSWSAYQDSASTERNLLDSPSPLKRPQGGWYVSGNNKEEARQIKYDRQATELQEFFSSEPLAYDPGFKGPASAARK